MHIIYKAVHAPESIKVLAIARFLNNTSKAHRRSPEVRRCGVQPTLVQLA